MSYCSQCGAEVNGPFCAQCGAAQIPEAAESFRASASNPFEAGSQEPANPSAADSATRPPSDPSAPNIPGFFGAIPACFRKFGTDRGRASRSEFWYFVLWFFLVFFLLCLPARIFIGLLWLSPGNDLTGVAAGALFLTNAVQIIAPWVLLTLFIPLGFAACRRLHDVSRSGWLIGGNWIYGFVSLVVSLMAGPFIRPHSGFDYGPALVLGCVMVGWMLLTLVIIVLLALPPTPGPNKYGPQPRKRR